MTPQPDCCPQHREMQRRIDLMMSAPGDDQNLLRLVLSPANQLALMLYPLLPNEQRIDHPN